MEIIQFIHEATWQDLPDNVRQQARRCLLDTLGAGVGGRATELSQIVYEFAAAAFGGQGAQLWLDGREVSPPGAALANGMTIDALDIHDGHSLTKGHAGAALVPGLFATVSFESAGGISGKEFLMALVIGYEIALRAGMALHDTACDYHTSGAWNALGVAALAARRFGLKSDQTRHALGIAEYHGPRSQMMRCIDHPTMLKDGSGWGAMTGISAALLAQAEFTGAPALIVESDEVSRTWQDLGSAWQITRQYFKPHAVCRWAQPAVEATLVLQQKYQLTPEQVKRVVVSTFHEAVRLNCRSPHSTEEAQYSLPFPLAAAFAHGRLGVSELTGVALKDPVVLQLCERVEMIEDASFNQRFPAKRFARVEIETEDGNVFDSGEVEPNWEASNPPSDLELREKFRRSSCEQLPGERAAELEQIIWRCDELPDLSNLLSLLTLPVTKE
ncbi:MmgE/PrpD [Olavius sp. associated proteobacterium Delta 1]|nr:MmgE/PrpD [Olavius sp. associated proteobacterium Delta 1]